MNNVRDELAHVGILGMKWGKRNGASKTIANKPKKLTREEKLDKQEKSRNKMLKKLTPEQTVEVMQRAMVLGDKHVMKILDKMDNKKISFEAASSQVDKVETRKRVAVSLGILGAFAAATIAVSS